MLLYNKLKDNTRYIEIHMPKVNTITLAVFIKAGSKYEDEKENGIAHFMEHMFFKGGKKYKTPKKVALAFDVIGANYNAFTSKEIVCYYAKASKNFFNNIVDVISDMLLHASFPEEEINKERNVILQELAMYDDEPKDVLDRSLEKLIYGNNGLGRDIIGNKETINTFTKTDFLNYQNKHYIPDNILIIVAGNLKDINTKKIIEQKFNFKTSNKKYINTNINFEYSNEKFLSIDKKTQQAHIALAHPAYGNQEKKVDAQNLLSVILGKCMSSRMFQNIREKHGLCYYIYTSDSPYIDKGYIATFAGLDKNKKDMAVELIKAEYQKIKKQKIPDSELQKAKNIVISKLNFIIENTIDTAFYYGVNWLVLNKKESIKKKIEDINKITTKDIFNIANELFIDEQLRYCEVV